MMNSEVSPTLEAGAGEGGNNLPMILANKKEQAVNGGGIEQQMIQTVRRLTPLECTRLQGYPDGWVDIGDWTDENGKLHKECDTPKYKALGNSIALPYWDWLLGRIADEYDRPATLGSLFDGISGFPLSHERHNGRGTALWSSEIEPFCIAVAKKHFGDEDTGIVGDVDQYLGDQP